MDNSKQKNSQCQSSCKTCEGLCQDKKNTEVAQPVFAVKIKPLDEIALVQSNVSYTKGKTFLIAETRYGLDLVEVLGPVKYHCNREFIEVIRIATAEDFELAEKQKIKAEETFWLAKQKINQHNLEMKLIATHYLHEENKILFLFTADQRVDFRELVKDLVATFHARIELRQIGVRDETRVVGGLAVCGHSFCCHSITDQLKPVAIKMVKDQNLSLNSGKISGSCGRLLCCLAYEHDFYAEARKSLPNENTKIKINNDIYQINEINVISDKITLTASDGRIVKVPIQQFSKDTAGHWQVKIEE